VTGVSCLLYGSPRAALARLRGDLLSVSPQYLDLGTGSEGQVLASAVEITNWTDRPVRLIGGTSDCSCVATKDLPHTVPPGAAKLVTIEVTAPKTGQGYITATRSCGLIILGNQRPP